MTQNSYMSLIQAAKLLQKSQVAQTYTSIKKAVNKLINHYIGKDELLIKGLKLMKNKHNVLIFISLGKVPNIEKQ